MVRGRTTVAQHVHGGWVPGVAVGMVFEERTLGSLLIWRAE